MVFLNIKCLKCNCMFDFDVGKINFDTPTGRPEFENQVECSTCGKLNFQEKTVELTELGQTQLGAEYFDGIF